MTDNLWKFCQCWWKLDQFWWLLLECLSLIKKSLLVEFWGKIHTVLIWDGKYVLFKDSNVDDSDFAFRWRWFCRKVIFQICNLATCFVVKQSSWHYVEWDPFAYWFFLWLIKWHWSCKNIWRVDLFKQVGVRKS